MGSTRRIAPRTISRETSSISIGLSEKQLSPAWEVGLVGYFLQQVTGDSGAGAILGSTKISVWALGPAATYSFAFGRTPVSLLAKWTQEIEASRTFQGDTVTAAFSLKFWAAASCRKTRTHGRA
jgi:hypothetical protein